MRETKVERTRMVLMLGLLVLSVVLLRQVTSTAASPRAAQSSEQSAPSLVSVVDGEIRAVEKQIVDVAEAMPEDRFNFSPESLNIRGSQYSGVRTFAVQVKHVGASNWFIWSPLTGEKVPEGLKDGNRPENLKSKAEIVQFLKDSFALGHRQRQR